MNIKNSRRIILRILSFICFAVVLILLIFEYQKVQDQKCVFPEAISIGGVAVGGLDVPEARIRLETVYESPITIRIDQSVVYLSPKDVGVQINYQNMLDEATASCSRLSTWQRLWNSLWNRPVTGFKTVNLVYQLNEESIRNYIDNELAIRYSILPTNAKSIQGTTEFQAGLPGRSLDSEKLLNDLLSAFTSPVSREVIATFIDSSGSYPDLQMIEGKLKEIIHESGFEGLTAIYLEPLPGDNSINFAEQNNNDIDPMIAFTAASTMKIPIMVSTFWRENLPLPEIIEGWLNHMLILSQNAPADRLMENIDPIRGPLIVTEDMQLLGLENTFIAGYFYLGSPLLELYSTPANSRTDINLDPDLYNQTTPQETGKLLSYIYACGESESGLLVEKSNGSITSEECQMMIDILSQNQIGALIEAGLPEGTQIAHKHGWSEEQDGLLHTVSDAAIVFGPEQDYVFTIFVYSPNQLLFDEANYLIAKLAQAAFNGLNTAHQIPWIFDN